MHPDKCSGFVRIFPIPRNIFSNFDVSKVFLMLTVLSIYFLIYTSPRGVEFEFSQGGKNIRYVGIYIATMIHFYKQVLLKRKKSSIYVIQGLRVEIVGTRLFLVFMGIENMGRLGMIW